MTKEFEIIPPRMPNFVRFKKPLGKNEDGILRDDWFDIVNFTRKEADEFAELMYRTFMEHWEKRVKEKSKS